MNLQLRLGLPLADVVRVLVTMLEQKLAGAEPCLICYSVLHVTTGEMAKLRCSTCNVLFHGVCLYKWFGNSNRSLCPHC